MTVLFLDSFDHYDSGDIGYKYHIAETSGYAHLTIESSGRISSNCILIDYGGYSGHYARIGRTIGANATVVVGGAFKFTALGGQTVFKLMDNATIQMQVGLRQDGLLGIYRGTTLLGVSSIALLANSYYYIEFKTTIDNTTGSYELRVGELTVASASGVDTQSSANAYVTLVVLECNNGASFQVSGGEGDMYVDDLYIADDDFLGDIHVEALLPTANGSQTDWTVGGTAGTANYECVDDNPPDDDSSYTYTDEVDTPKTDLYEMSDMSIVSGDVSAIQFVMFSRKDNADAVLVTPAIMPGTVVYNPAGTVSLTETYKFDLQVIEENPDTSSAFTVSEVNASEFGYTRPS